MLNFVNKNKIKLIILGGLMLIVIGIAFYIFMHLYYKRVISTPTLTPLPAEKPQGELMDERAFLQDLNEMMVQGKAAQEGAVAVCQVPIF